MVAPVVGVKYEILSGVGMRSESQSPALVTLVRAKYEISDSVTLAPRTPGEELGSLCWGIRLSQSEPFHIIGQGHLLSHRSGEAFPTNATRLAGSSTLCFTTISFPASLHPPKLSALFSLITSLSLYLLSVFFQPYSSPVIGYALPRCAIGPRHTRLERTRPWPHHTTEHLCRMLMNVCVWAHVSCDGVRRGG